MNFQLTFFFFFLLHTLGQTKHRPSRPAARPILAQYHYHIPGILGARVETRRDARCPVCWLNCGSPAAIPGHAAATHPWLVFRLERTEVGPLQMHVQLSATSPARLAEEMAASGRARAQVGGGGGGGAPAIDAADPLENFIFISGLTGPVLPGDRFSRPGTAFPHIFAGSRIAGGGGAGGSGGIGGAGGGGAGGGGGGGGGGVVPGSKLEIVPYVAGTYHSLTFANANQRCLVDSEHEYDDDWLIHHSHRRLDEFEDVDVAEKRLMKVWNRHMLRKGCLSNAHVPDAIEEFVLRHARSVVADGLERQVIAHLMTMWDLNLLTSQHLAKLLRLVRDAAEIGQGGPAVKVSTGSGVAPLAPAAQTAQAAPVKQSPAATADSFTAVQPRPKRMRRAPSSLDL
jgi:hypothetical protein